MHGETEPLFHRGAENAKDKEKVIIKPVCLQRRSPDLNPLVFDLWSEIERRMTFHSPKVKETKAAFKAPPQGRLDHSQAIYDAKGHDIEMD